VLHITLSYKHRQGTTTELPSKHIWLGCSLYSSLQNLYFLCWSEI
jgi:hypothetical protein